VGSGVEICCGRVGKIGSKNVLTSDALVQFLPEGDHAKPDYSSPAVEEGKRAGAERSGAVRRGFEDSGQSRESQPKAPTRSDDSQETDHVSGCPQTNRCCPACTLGEMEGGQAEQMKHNNGRGDPALLGSSCADP